MKLAVAPVFSAHKGETDEAYGAVLATLNGKLRVVHSRDANQWLLQVRKSPTRWETVAYCATKIGIENSGWKLHLQGRDEILPLAELVREHVEPEAWAVVQALPDYYPKQAQPEQKALADA